MDSEQREYRWVRLAIISAAIRVGLAAAPAACVAAFGVLLLRYLPRTAGHVDVATWLVLTILLSMLVLLAFEVLASRFRTLASLLDISMVFPYRPPSRLLVALGSPYYLELTGELDGVRRHLRRAKHAGDGDAEVRAHLDRVESILTLAALTGTLEPGTRRHSHRVAQLADRVAVVMGLDRQHRRWLRWAALLHDIGKLAVPDDILHKPARLSAEEREIVRRHVTDGVRIIAPLIPLLGPWARAVGEHHERWDGDGYPLGLKGEEISLAGRIVAVADTYATMTKGRIYQRRVQPAAGLRELQKNAGGQFDPDVVEAFAVSWRMRRSPAILYRLPRAAALTAGSIWASLGLPAASAGVTLGVVGAVALVAVTAPAVARALPAHPAGPIAGVENILGVAPAPAPSPTPVKPRPTPPPAVVALRPTPVPSPVALTAPAPVAVVGPPTVQLASSTNAVEGAVVTLEGTVSSADGTTPQVTVDYGDGAPLQGVPVSGGRFRLGHVYVDEGNCSIVITATSSHGSTRAISQVIIAEYKATVSLPAQASAPGAQLSQAGRLVDPSADTVFATVDYGDGSGPQDLPVNGRDFTLQHTYQQGASSPASYDVTISFRDDDGPGPVVHITVTPTAASS